MRPGVLGLRNLGFPCSGAISPGSNARRTSCGTVCRLWDQGMRNGTGALLVNADTSTGACARSCKRGSSLHSDPSRWETGQVKLLRRPMDRHSITKSTFILFQLPVQRKRRRNASTQAIFLQLAAATMLPAPSGETRGGMRSSTGSPHQMHIASSAKKKELAVEAPYHDISCQAGRPPPCVNGGRCGVL